MAAARELNCFKQLCSCGAKGADHLWSSQKYVYGGLPALSVSSVHALMHGVVFWHGNVAP
jgi:hypothetical protein